MRKLFKQKQKVQKRAVDANGNIHFSFIDTLKINQQEQREDRTDALVTFIASILLFAMIIGIEETTGTTLTASFNILFN